MHQWCETTPRVLRYQGDRPVFWLALVLPGPLPSRAWRSGVGPVRQAYSSGGCAGMAGDGNPALHRLPVSPRHRSMAGHRSLKGGILQAAVPACHRKDATSPSRPKVPRDRVVAQWWTARGDGRCLTGTPGRCDAERLICSRNQLRERTNEQPDAVWHQRVRHVSAGEWSLRFHRTVGTGPPPRRPALAAEPAHQAADRGRGRHRTRAIPGLAVRRGPLERPLCGAAGPHLLRPVPDRLVDRAPRRRNPGAGGAPLKGACGACRPSPAAPPRPRSCARPRAARRRTG